VPTFPVDPDLVYTNAKTGNVVPASVFKNKVLNLAP
jgi:hypothetical protein